MAGDFAVHAQAVDVEGLGPAKEVYAGSYNTCAVLQSGVTQCGGEGNNGQLLRGADLTKSSVPGVLEELPT